MSLLAFLAETAAHGHEEVKAPFPAFDPTWFASQLFWLAVFFLGLYFALGRYVLPKLSDTLEKRANRIASDLDEAARLIGDRHRSIYFVGGRITGALAEYFFTHMQVIRPKTTLMSSNASSWPQHVLNMHEGDVLVIFDIRRYEADLTTLAEVARANGVQRLWLEMSLAGAMGRQGGPSRH